MNTYSTAIFHYTEDVQLIMNDHSILEQRMIGYALRKTKKAGSEIQSRLIEALPVRIAACQLA
jgi:hypothetical protein